MKFICLLIVLSVSVVTHAQFVYEDRNYSPIVKTVLLEQKSKPMSEPVLFLGSSEKLLLQFDELTDDTHKYEYSIVHCNSDWTESGLDMQLYYEGFEAQSVEHYANSFNTIQHYVHYWQTIPSNEGRILKSGNYIVKVFKEGDPESVIFTKRFYVVDDNVNIRAQIDRSSDASLMYTHQQVDVNVMPKGNRMFQNAGKDMKVYVTQNQRQDNKRQLVLRGESGISMDYSFDKSNQFEGGNEFRNFDITSLRQKSRYVAGFDFDNNRNIVILRNEKDKKTLPYSLEKDINGKFLIENDYNEDNGTYSDYAMVCFTLPVEMSLEGDYYVCGNMTDNRLTAQNKMSYQDGAYRAALYLKQGYYNYQILFLKHKESVGSTKQIEGNHYETNNTYSIFVYYRNFSDNYDELVGYANVEYSR